MPTVSQSEETHAVRIDLGDRSYDARIGDGILDHLPEWLSEHPALGKRCAIIADPVLKSHYAEPMVEKLAAAGFEVTLIFTDHDADTPSEASKTMAITADLCSQMLRAGHDRKSFVIALGGGVIGDLAGFVAAVFQRGIPFVQIPTTIVSQVDSSVGGKTGVNTPEGKNLIGAFHQPALVVADTTTLQTLPDREYQQGFAEVIKHAAIRDADMFHAIAEQDLSRENLAPLIARNIALKAAVVEEDERETARVRALLNFGHTLGHGIENAAGYGQLLHGEAISLGMVAAGRLSVEHSTLSDAACTRMIDLLKHFHLPVTLPDEIDEAAVLEAMQRDKKFEGGAIRFVLLRALGEAFVSDAITSDHLQAALAGLRSPA